MNIIMRKIKLRFKKELSRIKFKKMSLRQTITKAMDDIVYTYIQRISESMI